MDTFPELVAEAVDGDREATSALLAALHPKIIRYCRARVGQSQSGYCSADDVAQDVLMAVFTALPRYAGTGSDFLSFAYGIAGHKVADFHRKYYRDRARSASEPQDMPDRYAGPEQQVLRGELGAPLYGLLETLTSRQHEVLILRVIVGLSVDETAGAMSMTAGAVRVTQHRALANLRKRLTAVVSE